MKTAGQKFREALKENNPLQIIGVINAYSAIPAQKKRCKSPLLKWRGISGDEFGGA